jgi:hypothetical protein
MEEVGGEMAARLIVRWKTKDPDVARRYIAEALNVGYGRRVSVIVVDGSNERYFAADLKKFYTGKIPVVIMVSSENAEYLGETMSTKTYLGNALVNAFDEYKIWLPANERIRVDMRLVTKSRGGFDNNVDGEGHHGDTFDSTKLARHGIVTRSGGSAEARAVAGGALGRLLAGVAAAGRGPWGRRDGGNRSLMG